MKDFKARISGCRARKGLSQQELADLIDVSLRSVQNWESGESEPHGKHLRKLSEALETPIPYLLGETAPQTQARNEPYGLHESASAAESEVEHWKRRAKEAENKLNELRNGLRSLLELSSGNAGAEVAPGASSKPPSLAARAAKKLVGGKPRGPAQS